MKLSELVDEAKAKSPEFKKKLEYWTHKRKKQPDLIWLMLHLETVLGRTRVRQAAEFQIKEANHEPA